MDKIDIPGDPVTCSIELIGSIYLTLGATEDTGSGPGHVATNIDRIRVQFEQSDPIEHLYALLSCMDTSNIFDHMTTENLGTLFTFLIRVQETTASPLLGSVLSKIQKVLGVRSFVREAISVILTLNNNSYFGHLAARYINHFQDSEELAAATVHDLLTIVKNIHYAILDSEDTEELKKLEGTLSSIINSDREYYIGTAIAHFHKDLSRKIWGRFES